MVIDADSILRMPFIPERLGVKRGGLINPKPQTLNHVEALLTALHWGQGGRRWNPLSAVAYPAVCTQPCTGPLLTCSEWQTPARRTSRAGRS